MWASRFLVGTLALLLFVGLASPATAKVSWDWKLDSGELDLEDYGANKGAKSPTLSCAMALSWLKTRGKGVEPDQKNYAGKLKHLEPLRGNIQKKCDKKNKVIMAPVAKSLNSKLKSEGLELTSVSTGDWDKKALSKAVKALDEGYYLLYGQGAKVFCTVAIHRKSGRKTVFNPYAGQFYSKKSSNIAAELVTSFEVLSLSTFEIMKVSTGEQEVAIAWDWFFAQKDPQDPKTGKFMLRILAKDPVVNDGVCFGMAYNWCKRIQKKEKPKRANFEDTKSYLKIVQGFRKYDRNSDYYLDLGKAQGMKMELIGPTDFKRSWSEITDSINALKTGAYMFVFRCDGGGHATAVQVTTKGTSGKFFDPNLGQFSIAKGQYSLGEFVADTLKSVYGVDSYPRGNNGKWFFVDMEVTDKKKLKAAPELP
ncbi:YopT-type cysteine protease domain-containing protein [Planctomycetota bacterium]